MPNRAYLSFADTVIPVLDAVVDGYPSTTHLIEVAKSDEPLEDGTSITDHAVTLPEALRLSGWVTDMNGSRRPAAAWAEIRRLARENEPLTVTTEIGAYSEMLIQRMEGRQSARGLKLTIELAQVIRVGNPSSSLPPDQVTGPAAQRTGSVDRGRVRLPQQPVSFGG